MFNGEKEILKEITITLPCYNCGELLQTNFRLFIGAADYVYCHSCKAGIEITLNQDILMINCLSYEG